MRARFASSMSGRSPVRKDSLSKPQKFIALLIAACFMLQSMVPIGYMPGSLSQDGSLIKFCPSGVSDAVMAILHADHAGHLQHAGHSQHTGHALASSVSAELVLDDQAHHHHHGAHHKAQLNAAADFVAGQDSSAHSDHGSEHHSVWQSDCEFGASAGTDLCIASLSEASQVNPSFYSALLRAFDLHASLTRSKKQSRAPPVS